MNDPRRVLDAKLLSTDHVDPIFRATVEATEEAVVNALMKGETMTGMNGNTVYALPYDRLAPGDGEVRPPAEVAPGRRVTNLVATPQNQRRWQYLQRAHHLVPDPTTTGGSAGAYGASRLYFFSTSRSRSCGSALTRWPSAPVMVSAATMRVDDRLFGRLHRGLEERVHLARSAASAASARPSALTAPGLAVEKAMKMSPEPLPAMLPVRARPERGAARQPLELVRQQRRVGRDDDDDRAGLARIVGHAVGRCAGVCGISRPTGTPAIVQLRRAAEVGLHQHADGVAARSRPDHARRRCRCRP